MHVCVHVMHTHSHTHRFGSRGHTPRHLITPAIIDEELSLGVIQCVHHSLGEEEGAVMDAPEAKGGSVEQRGVLLLLKCV